MEKQYNRLLRYSGTKYPYLNIILPYVNSSKKLIYCEPFLGSGSVFLNSNDTFKKYIISDIDRNVIRIFKSFKEINYNDYIHYLNDVTNTFGNIKTSKESYYNFRNWFNENYWNTDSTVEGIYLMFLANSCINSMLRFGPNGMNQSYGNRGYQYSYTKDVHMKIKNKLQNTEILNLNFFENLDFFEKIDGLFFIDPPYIKRTTSYSNINEEQRLKLLSFLKNNEYIYTDIYENNIKDYLKCNIKIIRNKMRNTSPLTNKNELNNTEVIFTNLNAKNLQLF